MQQHQKEQDGCDTASMDNGVSDPPSPEPLDSPSLDSPAVSIKGKSTPTSSDNDVSPSMSTSTPSFHSSSHAVPFICMICLEEFRNATSLVKLSHCRHLLCPTCFERHTASSNKCPMCKTPIHDAESILETTMEQLNAYLTGAVRTLEKLVSMDSTVLLSRHTSSSSGTSSGGGNNTSSVSDGVHDAVVTIKESVKKVLLLMEQTGIGTVSGSSSLSGLFPESWIASTIFIEDPQQQQQQQGMFMPPMPFPAPLPFPLGIPLGFSTFPGFPPGFPTGFPGFPAFPTPFAPTTTTPFHAPFPATFVPTTPTATVAASTAGTNQQGSTTAAPRAREVVVDANPVFPARPTPPPSRSPSFVMDYMGNVYELRPAAAAATVNPTVAPAAAPNTPSRIPLFRRQSTGNQYSRVSQNSESVPSSNAALYQHSSTNSSRSSQTSSDRPRPNNDRDDNRDVGTAAANRTHSNENGTQSPSSYGETRRFNIDFSHTQENNSGSGNGSSMDARHDLLDLFAQIFSNLQTGGLAAPPDPPLQ